MGPMAADMEVNTLRVCASKVDVTAAYDVRQLAGNVASGVETYGNPWATWKLVLWRIGTFTSGQVVEPGAGSVTVSIRRPGDSPTESRPKAEVDFDGVLTMSVEFKNVHTTRDGTDPAEVADDGRFEYSSPLNPGLWYTEQVQHQR